MIKCCKTKYPHNVPVVPVCEKGKLEIDWAVMSEARAIVRQRLGSRRRLEEQDFHELTGLIATRYQVAKETYLRQERR